MLSLKVLYTLLFMALGMTVSLVTSYNASLAFNDTVQLKSSVIPKILNLVGMDSMVTAPNGANYSLAALRPDASLYSTKYFAVMSDSPSSIVDKRTGEVESLTIFLASYDDGTTILAEKDEEGKVVYAEIHQGNSISVSFLVGDVDHPNKFLSFSEDDIDIEGVNARFHFGPDLEMPPDVRRQLGQVDGYSNVRFSDTVIGGCALLKVVDIAIVFDGEFCAMHGDFQRAKSAIKMIVASASRYYERYMCIKLKLTGIYTPESSCQGDRYFVDFNRVVPCGNEKGVDTFLKEFTRWAREYRVAEDIDPDATIHMFSGFEGRSGTVGCAWIGSTCTRSYSYAVEFMSGLSRQSQQIVFAHELAHNLNARHLPMIDEYDFIMEPFLGNGRNGFSRKTIGTVSEFLDRPSVTCDSVEKPNVLVAPSPSSMPSSNPTQYSTSQPSNEPSFAPSRRISREISNDESCQVAQGSIDPVCAVRSDKGRYACFDELTLLDPAIPRDCMGVSPSLRLLSCQDKEYDNDIPSGGFRELKKEKGSADGQAQKISSHSCGEKCVEKENYICLLAESDADAVRVYNVTYSVTVGAAPSVVSAFVLVLHEVDNGAENCETVSTRCEKGTKKLLRG